MLNCRVPPTLNAHARSRQIDKFLYSNDDNIKAGALLSVGVLSCGTRNECDPALALLAEYVEAKHPSNIKMGAIFGLGLAYAGHKKEEVCPPDLDPDFHPDQFGRGGRRFP